MKIVETFMVSDPTCIGINENLESAMNTLESQNLTHLLVTDNGLLVGVISKTDVLQKFKNLLKRSGGKTYHDFVLKTLKVIDFMTKDPITVKPDDNIDTAVKLLLENSFHILPVVNADNEPVGVLSSSDLLRGLYKS